MNKKGIFHPYGGEALSIVIGAYLIFLAVTEKTLLFFILGLLLIIFGLIFTHLNKMKEEVRGFFIALSYLVTISITWFAVNFLTMDLFPDNFMAVIIGSIISIILAVYIVASLERKRKKEKELK